jgi:hypothetical protein
MLNARVKDKLSLCNDAVSLPSFACLQEQTRHLRISIARRKGQGRVTILSCLVLVGPCHRARVSGHHSDSSTAAAAAAAVAAAAAAAVGAARVAAARRLGPRVRAVGVVAVQPTDPQVGPLVVPPLALPVPELVLALAASLCGLVLALVLVLAQAPPPASALADGLVLAVAQALPPASALARHHDLVELLGDLVDGLVDSLALARHRAVTTGGSERSRG